MKRSISAVAFALAVVLAACGGGGNQGGQSQGVAPQTQAPGGGGNQPSITPGLQPSIPLESESAPPGGSPSAGPS